ncbi:MFS transporter [Sphingomonas sp. CBMAI 2297]|uniref:MFS transporter n=1 Tax=Sphingomonas sp. CBMAI 2297 TaxID=2991720 RepID=UPI00245883A5|nr:MFS transporter [Sphingomonas sp. CBMAI 2297]MDH4743649.1 MFS transporter [Sphingomonas sp. CBMAI 2297]
MKRAAWAVPALITSYALLGLLMNSVGTVILQSIAHYGVSKPQAATLEACKDLSVVVASFLFATALPRFGFRRAQIGVMLAVAAGALAISFANSFWAMQLFFVLVGLCFGIAKVATYSSIGLVRPDPARHASLTSLIEGVFMVGILAGIWLFGWFIGQDMTGQGWLGVYRVIAVLALATAVLWWFADLDESAAKAAQGEPGTGYRDALALLVLPSTIAFLAAIFLYVLIEQGVGTWLPTFNNQVLHLPSAMSVQASSIFIAALAVGRLSASGLVARLGWLRLLLGCLALIAALVLLTLPTTQGLHPRANMGWLDAPAAAYIFPLIGMFMAPIYPIVSSVVLSALPRERHAAMVGLMVIFSALGGTIGSFITGFTFDRFSGQTAFYLVLVPLVLIALALVRLERLTRKPSNGTA